jgi:hypothetical protein
MDSLALAAALAYQIALSDPRWRDAAMLAALALLLAAVLDPTTCRPAGRLRLRVVGWPVGVRLRLQRSDENRIRRQLC